jgi:hypothetical protein
MWRETGSAITKTTEQSQNVYENKGSVQKSTTRWPPPYPRRGIAGRPSSDEEGLGVVGHLHLGMKPAL